MTKKTIEELNIEELDDVQGGAIKNDDSRQQRKGGALPLEKDEPIKGVILSSETFEPN